MTKPLRVLLVEDSEDDVRLLLVELRRGGYDPVSARVETASEMGAALDTEAWDIIISDYRMPQFNGLAALKLVQGRGLDLPFILVSGAIGDDLAVEAMKAGAHDFLVKGSLARLAPAVERELCDAEARRQRRRAEEELRTALDQAQAANRAKEHFLAVVSHELRTPLTPVLLTTHILARRTDLPLAVKDALKMIRRNIQLEVRLIDDLLDLTRLERGKIEILDEEVDVHKAIRRAVEVSTPDIEARGQCLEMALDAARHHLRGDMTRLQQVCWNLLKNSSKFTPNGGRIRLASHNEPGRIVIVVTDNGIGIEPDSLRKIFLPFEQADDSIARSHGGLGLGLAIAKANVDAHGGQITATSAGRDHGATFTFTLPLP